LPIPGLAGHRRDDDRVHRFLGAVDCQQFEDVGDLLVPAGEVGDRRGQQARHHAFRPEPECGPTGGRLELVPMPAGQLQCVGQPPDRVRVGPADPVAFEVAQGPFAQPSPFGQLLLGEPEPPTVRPHQPTQRHVVTGPAGCLNILLHVPLRRLLCLGLWVLCPCRPGQRVYRH
jgi:hypothetical protein